MSIKRFLTSFALGASLLGCDGEISEADARGWYDAQKGTIDQIDAGVRRAVGQMAWFSEASGPESPRGALGHDAERDRRERTRAVQEITALSQLPGVRGVVVTYVVAPGGATEQLVSAGQHPRADRNDAVRAGDGFTADGREIGWGGFQAEGGGDYQPGLEARWQFARGEIAFTVETAVLIEGS